MTMNESPHFEVAIIDYGMGNLYSLKHALESIGAKALLTNNAQDIINARAAILPGVGAFGEAMTRLVADGLVPAIHQFIDSGKPFLGICLGMQLLFTESEEFGHSKGLGVIEGCVNRLPACNSAGTPLRIPHIGWNRIYAPAGNGVHWTESPLCRTADKEFMYFVHSYYAIPTQPEHVLTLTQYSQFEFVSGVRRNNVVGLQFHPEKSGRKGLEILRAFTADSADCKEDTSQDSSGNAISEKQPSITEGDNS